MDTVSILHLDGSQADVGGILSFLRGIQEGTVQHGIRHEVAVHEDFVQQRAPQLTCCRVRGFVGDDASYLKMLVSGLKSAVHVRAMLRTRRFDVLHGHSRTGWVVGWLLAGRVAPRVVLTNHTYAKQRGLYRRAMAKPSVTPVMLTPQMARYYGVPSDGGRVRLISPCCADRFFEAPLKAPRKDPDRVHLVGVGNLVRWKGWHLIIEAMAMLPETVRRRLRVTVYGPMKKGTDSEVYAGELADRIQKLGLADLVRFPGATNEIQQKVGECDWLIHPSRNEAFGIAVVEAMAMGRPVIVSRSGGPLDIVRDGETGLFFDTDQAKSLAEVLGRIATGTETSAGMEGIRESVRQYSATAIGTRYAGLYRELAETKRAIPKRP